MPILKINDKALGKIVEKFMPKIHLYTMAKKMYEAVWHKKEAYFVYDEEFGTYKVMTLEGNEELEDKYVPIYKMSVEEEIPYEVVSSMKNNTFSPDISRISDYIFEATMDYWNNKMFDIYSPDVNENDVEIKRYLF